MHQSYELMYCSPLFLDKLVMSMTPPDTVCWYLQQREPRAIQRAKEPIL